MTDKHIEDDIPIEQDNEQQNVLGEKKALLTGIGRHLRKAREQRQVSLDEVARELKLRLVFLSALENGNWDELPGDIYGIGFTRQYAHFLDIDLEADIARINSGEYRLTKPLTFPDPPIAPAKRWAVTAILLFIILFIAFNVYHSVDRNHRELPLPIPTPPAPSIMPKSNAPSGKSTTPTPTAPTPTAPTPTAPTPTAPTPTAPTPTAPTPTAPTPTAPTPTTPAEAKTTPQFASSTAISSHSYSFEAVGGDVWLQIYRKQGQLLKEALLRNGQHMTIESDATYLVMDCGNVGAIKISVDSKPLIAPGQLGSMGKVVRNFHLAPPA